MLKSGCKAEESKLRTAERLVNLIAVFCIIGWRIFWLTMVNRTAPDAPPNLALTKPKCDLLDHLVLDKSEPPEPQASHNTSSKSPGLAAISPAPTIPPPEISSCGADCRASPISSWALSQEQNLWVIESR